MDLTRENDADQLRLIAQTALKQVEALTKVVAQQSAQIDQLLGKAGALQQALELAQRLQKKAELEAPAERPKGQGKKKKRTSFGATPQPELPQVTKKFELDAPDMTCPSCGGELAEFEGQFDESEMVDVVEVSYRVVKVQQQKYVCGCGGCVETAPGPERATSGGRYSLAFAAKVAIDKYLDHLPLERQTRIMKRHGLRVTTQTLWKQLDVLAKELRPAYEALHAHILEQPVIGLDQTSWKRLAKKKATPFQMWCLTSPGVVFHTIRDDKSLNTFTDVVGEFHGVVVCDAMSTHKAAARGSPHIELAACWAHVFRKFDEVTSDRADAERAIEWIRTLYEIDEEAHDLEARRRIRDTRSRVVVAEMWAWLNDLEVLTSTSFGAAARYAHDNWRNLIRFLDDPKIPLDNNATERGIRGPVVGRKNHYGSKSVRGTEVASIFYTLMETAKLNDLDPAAYLTEAVQAARLGEIKLPLG